jgi:hypothetical protein
MRPGLIPVQAVAIPSGEWTDGVFPVLGPRGFYSTAEAEHEREQPDNPRHRRLISEDNLEVGKVDLGGKPKLGTDHDPATLIEVIAGGKTRRELIERIDELDSQVRPPLSS